MKHFILLCLSVMASVFLLTSSAFAAPTSEMDAIEVSTLMLGDQPVTPLLVSLRDQPKTPTAKDTQTNKALSTRANNSSNFNEYRKSIFQTGTASWYGPRFYGRKTASGEVFTKNQLTAAHRTLPFGTKLRVTNTTTGKSVIVKVNDRGPFHGNRVIDLSHAAASQLDMIKSGVCKVTIEKI